MQTLCNNQRFPSPFTGATPLTAREHSFGRGTGPIFLDTLQCSGDEDQLLDCEHVKPLGLVECDHSHDAGVHCEGENQNIII